MTEFTAADVGKLREMTGAGLMECKKALTECKGDINAAVDHLRKKGGVLAAKKASRETKEGAIVQFIQPGAKVGVLVEVNCETDFVARNETFGAFCADVAKRLASQATIESLEADRVAAVDHDPMGRAALVSSAVETFEVFETWLGGWGDMTR